MLLVQPEQGVLVLRQPEEVVLLLQPLNGPAVNGAERSVDELGFDLELLAAHAVRPAIGARVDLAPVVQALDELLDRPFMAFLGGADEVVVGDKEPLPHLLPPGHDLVRPLLRGEALLLGRAGDLLPVLVGPGEEEDLLPAEAVVPGDHVARHRGVGVPDVRDVVHVIDGGGDVEGVLGLAHGPAIVGTGRSAAIAPAGSVPRRSPGRAGRSPWTWCGRRRAFEPPPERDPERPPPPRPRWRSAPVGRLRSPGPPRLEAPARRGPRRARRACPEGPPGGAS